ncbi:MAG: DUF86 domain-containing protein [Oscillospiraceae bacterium]|nr:DUF86 domain-containing protein [Oscillospiraceae bacterium]
MREYELTVLKKINSYANQTIEFKGDIEFSEFCTDFKTISACVFNLSQIGELSGKLGDDFKSAACHIPWQKIKGLRNRIVHDYEGIQYNMIWDVLVNFLPKLIEDIGEILDREICR